jgi:hypothetical protein
MLARPCHLLHARTRGLALHLVGTDTLPVNLAEPIIGKCGCRSSLSVLLIFGCGISKSASDVWGDSESPNPDDHSGEVIDASDDASTDDASASTDATDAWAEAADAGAEAGRTETGSVVTLMDPGFQGTPPAHGGWCAAQLSIHRPTLTAAIRVCLNFSAKPMWGRCRLPAPGCTVILSDRTTGAAGPIPGNAGRGDPPFGLACRGDSGRRGQHDVVGHHPILSW